MFYPWIHTRETVKVLWKEQISQNGTKSIIVQYVSLIQEVVPWIGLFRRFCKTKNKQMFYSVYFHKALLILIEKDSVKYSTAQK